MLNTTGPLAELWVSPNADDATAFSRIASAGVPRTFQSVLQARQNTGATLLSASYMNPRSPYSLIQFLSGGGVAANQGTDFRLLDSIVLRPSTGSAAPETIVDTYIVASGKGLGKGSAYTYSTNATPRLTQAEIWSDSDMNSDGALVNPRTLLGKLLTQGYLITQRELFNPAEFRSGAMAPPGGAESLVYLYKLEQDNKGGLTAEQTQRKLSLESRNLRFFAAFLAEYCFYRTRYSWLLAKYFTIYSQQASSGANVYTPPGLGSPVFQLFTGVGDGEQQYQLVNGVLPQATYLKGLVYHMACLNTRMTDMRKLLAAINTYYRRTYSTIQSVINDETLTGSNADLTRKITALNASSEETKKYLTEAEFRKGAMEYNAEKNRYANMLLGLYAFLNIAAVAMVIQISR